MGPTDPKLHLGMNIEHNAPLIILKCGLTPLKAIASSLMFFVCLFFKRISEIKYLDVPQEALNW